MLKSLWFPAKQNPKWYFLASNAARFFRPPCAWLAHEMRNMKPHNVAVLVMLRMTVFWEGSKGVGCMRWKRDVSYKAITE